MTDGEWDANRIGELKLENEVVRLRRLSAEDRSDYAKIAFDPAIWEYFVSPIYNEKDLDAFIEQADRDLAAGTRVVFSIIEKRSSHVAGSTAFGNIVPRERRLEIGWSWLGRDFQGTGVNRAAKQLLLDHAFDVLACERVEFKTDILNVRARRALKGIGATEEGTLRSFNYMPGGRRRDAVYYSILKSEWPKVRAEHFNLGGAAP
jgi:RimJ/RimL family protein N-acetyltransferase